MSTLPMHLLDACLHTVIETRECMGRILDILEPGDGLVARAADAHVVVEHAHHDDRAMPWSAARASWSAICHASTPTLIGDMRAGRCARVRPLPCRVVPCIPLGVAPGIHLVVGPTGIGKTCMAIRSAAAAMRGSSASFGMLDLVGNAHRGIPAIFADIPWHACQSILLDHAPGCHPTDFNPNPSPRRSAWTATGAILACPSTYLPTLRANVRSVLRTLADLTAGRSDPPIVILEYPSFACDTDDVVDDVLRIGRNARTIIVENDLVAPYMRPASGSFHERITAAAASVTHLHTRQAGLPWSTSLPDHLQVPRGHGIHVDLVGHGTAFVTAE